jgi:hypothetical protein
MPDCQERLDWWWLLQQVAITAAAATAAAQAALPAAAVQVLLSPLADAAGGHLRAEQLSE